MRWTQAFHFWCPFSFLAAHSHPWVGTLTLTLPCLPVPSGLPAVVLAWPPSPGKGASGHLEEPVRELAQVVQNFKYQIFGVHFLLMIYSAWQRLLIPSLRNRKETWSLSSWFLLAGLYVVHFHAHTLRSIALKHTHTGLLGFFGLFFKNTEYGGAWVA